jgi:hypothetical protein
MRQIMIPDVDQPYSIFASLLREQFQPAIFKCIESDACDHPCAVGVHGWKGRQYCGVYVSYLHEWRAVLNSEVNADNQELTTKVSQRDSQNPSIMADAELQRVIEAWGKLPSNLKTAIMAIVRSNNFHL